MKVGLGLIHPKLNLWGGGQTQMTDHDKANATWMATTELWLQIGMHNSYFLVTYIPFTYFKNLKPTSHSLLPFTKKLPPTLPIFILLLSNLHYITIKAKKEKKKKRRERGLFISSVLN